MAVRKQTYITEDQERALKRLAHAMGLSEAEILRRAVDLYLRTEGADGRDPYADMIGIVNTGRGDGSVTHDSIYDRH